jgi:hypothetical protein
MKLSIVLIVTLFLLQSCLPEGKNKSLTYQNIIIISDLSDRIEPTINGNIPNMQYPSKDISEILKIIDFFKNECVKPGEKIGDKSCISFSTFSNESIACIDIDKIKDLGAKQEFINSTRKYQDNGLEFEINNFKQKVESAYNDIRNKGLDLISITIDKIENKPIIKKNTILTNGIDTTFVNYDNHIYIFTDGYLEYKGKSLNKQYYFGNSEIEKIRKYCEDNNVDIDAALKSNISLCLPPVKNDKNQLINLHILETHERDKNTKLQTYKNPKGLRDNEILEAVWRKWAEASGFKSFEWKKY